MKMRHRRKIIQTLVLIAASARSRKRAGVRSQVFVTWARRCGKATLWARFEDRHDREMAHHRLQIERHANMVAMWQQDFELPTLTELEVVAQKVVQDAELFDRTLEHYFRPGDLEAIPVGRGMGASHRFYERRLREAGDSLGLSSLEERAELRRAARRYSTSAAYRQWLRDNPPEVRR